MFREEKLISLIKHRAAEFFRTEVPPGVIVTVRDVTIEHDGHRATIFVTTLPESEELSALKILREKTGLLKTYIFEHAQVGRLPDLVVQIDRGEKLRQHIDTLSKK